MQQIYNVGKAGSNGTEVVANPTLSGNEAELTSIGISGTNFKIPSGGGSGGTITPNPGYNIEQTTLESLGIDNNNYNMPTGLGKLSLSHRLEVYADKWIDFGTDGYYTNKDNSIYMEKIKVIGGFGGGSTDSTKVLLPVSNGYYPFVEEVGYLYFNILFTEVDMTGEAPVINSSKYIFELEAIYDETLTRYVWKGRLMNLTDFSYVDMKNDLSISFYYYY